MVTKSTDISTNNDADGAIEPPPARTEPPAGSNGASAKQEAEAHARAAARNHELAKMRHDPEAIRHAFETGAYPYKNKIKRTSYNRHKEEL